ncbi:uncharacterized protein LOC134813395 isoform X2 [Bolinopsis microptera]|uniref:uncharacterized protein LOC134813395 isoform X2 n=1 Tax=Bolinopsis microptera TaxID=2820187 RepID=UPI003078B3A1
MIRSLPLILLLFPLCYAQYSTGQAYNYYDLGSDLESAVDLGFAADNEIALVKFLGAGGTIALLILALVEFVLIIVFFCGLCCKCCCCSYLKYRPAAPPNPQQQIGMVPATGMVYPNMTAPTSTYNPPNPIVYGPGEYAREDPPEYISSKMDAPILENME